MVVMIERKHLRIIRAVQRVVAAAQELTEAERALRQKQRRARAKGARRTTATVPGINNQTGAARQVTQRPSDSPGRLPVGNDGADRATA